MTRIGFVKSPTSGGGGTPFCLNIVAFFHLNIFKFLGRFLIGFVVIFLANPKLYAVELDTICSNPLRANCEKNNTTTNQSVENSKDFALVDDKKIIFNSPLGSFTNRGTITELREGNAGGARIDFENLGSFTNYGTIGVSILLVNNNNSRVENYGTMGTLSITNGEISILNVGTMGAITTLNSYSHTKATLDYRSICKTNCSVNASEVVLQNYGLQITRTANDFNTDTINNGISNSHISMGITNASFYDANSKIILDFGGNFEFGKEYSLNNIVLGNNNSPLPVDFYRLTLQNPDIYRLTQSGEYFIVNELSGGDIHTPITESNKNNVVVMNNFFLTSNFVIYRQKLGAQRLTKRKRTLQKRVIRKKVSNLFQNHNLDESIESNDLFAYNNTNPLESNETFFYDSPSYLANNRQTRTMRTRNLNTTNQSTKSNANRATQSTQSDKYYFILTPYVNHNLYFKAGNYNLSGLDGGFITAFSGKISPSNYLGTHFGFSYGSLSDKGDKAFSIKSANLMLGLNYKFDMIWNMYLKARGDFYYFINEISSASVAKIKPNNIGFGASVAYGKDFNFGSGGVLGAELGLDYKALNANTLNVKSALNNSALQDYEKALYNLIYLDLGANYHKYFGDFGLNARLGICGNLAPKLAKSKLIVSDKAIDILIDNDKFAGYISVGGSYVLNAKDFDMEFGLAFNGIYGDRAMSNGGSLEWRIVW